MLTNITYCDIVYSTNRLDVHYRRYSMKNYYTDIDKAINEYEVFAPYKTKDIDWICNRIDWCYKWKHITEKQMNELADRIIFVMENRMY